MGLNIFFSTSALGVLMILVAHFYFKKTEKSMANICKTLFTDF